MPQLGWSTDSHRAANRQVLTDDETCKSSSILNYFLVSVCVCLQSPSPPLGPVRSGTSHCSSEVAHPPPWGLLLALCVPGGACSTCSRGHSLQYVEKTSFLLVLVQCGWMSHAQWCGLLDTLTCAGRKNVYNFDIWQRVYLRRVIRICRHVLQVIGLFSFALLWRILVFAVLNRMKPLLEPHCVFLFRFRAFKNTITF